MKIQSVLIGIRASCVLTLVTAFAAAQIVEVGRDSQAAGRDAVLRTRLDNMLVDIEFDKVSAGDVFDFLPKRFDLNLSVNWDALAAAGIQPDVYITLRRRQVPFRQAMDAVLTQLGGSETALGFEVVNNVVLVSTKEDLDRRIAIRIYDVTDFDTGVWSTRTFRDHGLPGWMRGGVGGGLRPPPEDVRIPRGICELIDAIVVAVDTSSWRECGGNVGWLRPVGDQLVICQTIAAHREIGEFWAALRKARGTTPQSLRAKLKSTRVDVDFDATSFDAALDWLGARHDLNFAPNWPALETAGIERTAEINLDLKNTTLEDALRLMLEQVGGGETAMDFEPYDTAIVISTREDLSRHVFTRVYDVSDFVEGKAVTRSFRDRPEVGGAYDGPPLASQPAIEVTVPEEMASLIDLIIVSVDRDSWRVTGGNVGTIRPFGTSLVMTHTSRTHREIEEFLSALTAAIPSPAVVEVVLVELPAQTAIQVRRNTGGGFPYLNAADLEALLTDAVVRMRMPTDMTDGGRPLEFRCELTDETVCAATQPASLARERASDSTTLDIRAAVKPAPDRMAALCDLVVSLEPGPGDRFQGMTPRRFASTVRIAAGGFAVPFAEQGAATGGRTEWWLIVVAQSRR